MLSAQKFLHCIPATKAAYCIFSGFYSSDVILLMVFRSTSELMLSCQRCHDMCCISKVSRHVTHTSQTQNVREERLRVLFPLSGVSRTLRGCLERHSMAGCVECQKEGMRQEKGLAVVFCLEGSGNGGWTGAGTGRQCTDTQAAAETLTSPLKAWEKEVGLESPFLCKSCSAAAGRPQDFHMKAKPSGPRDVEGLSWGEKRGWGVSGSHRPSHPCSLSLGDCVLFPAWFYSTCPQ